MPYIPTENHLPKKDVGKFREWEFWPNTNLQPSTSPPPSSETTPSLATVNDGHHHPQRPSMAHNNPSTPRNDKKDAWAPRQQVNERGRRFALVTARWQLTANDDISRRSSFASMLNEVCTISPPPSLLLANTRTRCHVAAVGDVATKRGTTIRYRRSSLSFLSRRTATVREYGDEEGRRRRRATTTPRIDNTTQR
jgi:hypothetical protein